MDPQQLAKLGLKDLSLFGSGSFVHGEFPPYATVSAALGLPRSLSTKGSKLAVSDPATNKPFVELESASPSLLERAIESGFQAQKSWAKVSPSERQRLLNAWYDLIIANQDDLAKLMTLENGKVIHESKAEVAYAASFVDWFAGESVRICGDYMTASTNSRAIVMKQPVGLCAAITPWNFPAAMVTRKVAPALAAGCSVILKPSELTPLSALALAELSRRAGIPAGVFNVIVSHDAKFVGQVLCTDPRIRKLSFTGSTQVGKLLLQQCSLTVKKTSMELGGLASFIIMDDADLNLALKALLMNKFRNSGQTCISTNRVYVHETIFDRFAALASEQIGNLKVGNGFDADAKIGPLITTSGINKVIDHVNDAINKGAKVVVGGSPAREIGDLFFKPTLLVNVNDTMRISKEETFGPVVPCFKFSTEDEVIQRANNVPYGLASYLFTKDLGRAIRMSEALECGIVGLNESAVSDARMPFGGVKESGMGREGSKYGIEEYLEIKYVLVGGINAP